MATLYQIGENGSQAEQWEVGEKPVLVGRKGHAQVSIEDEGVSRRHFVISREGEDYVIKDLNSRNGTWVKGRRVSVEKLRHNDRIQAGRTLFRFAERPARFATVGTGPHGTVIVSGSMQLECRPAESIVWPEDAGNRDIAAAA